MENDVFKIVFRDFFEKLRQFQNSVYEKKQIDEQIRSLKKRTGNTDIHTYSPDIQSSANFVSAG